MTIASIFPAELTALRASGLVFAAALIAFAIWRRRLLSNGAVLLALLGGLALFGYGFVATLQPDPNFGRVLAAYGGVFVAGSLAWGIVFDEFRPDRLDLVGAAVCLVGVGVIMYAPRG